jgi:hypothetical protein
MAEYKVIQDVEAEDKLVGALTFRQFVYALVAALLGYLSYFLIAHHAGFLAVPFIPIALISGFFAFPWGRDQPTEIWALAKVRYYFKSRRRLWDQSGAKELVTITAPKKVSTNYTNGLNQNEVHSRLRVLADTLDSRGWAVRNANPNSPNQVVQAIANQNSDRLLYATPAPIPTLGTDVKDSDDIMDAQNNPIARQFNDMIDASAKAHRQQIISNLQQTQATPAAASAGQSSTGSGRWFLGQPTQPTVAASQNAVTFSEQVVTPGTPAAALPIASANPTTEEETLIKQLVQEVTKPTISYAHLHTIQPLSAAPPQSAAPPASTVQATPLKPAVQPVSPPVQQAQAPVTQPQDAGILDLASNNDLNVATIAREAQKRRPQDEVVISLH